MMSLTTKQQRVLDLIRDYVRAHHRPPTVRELMALGGFKSPRSIQQYLDVLEEHGLIERDRRSSRGIRLTEETGIPVVGLVAAGQPILAEEHVGEYLDVSPWVDPPDRDGTRATFAVRVKGESMRDCGIMDGDHVIVQKDAPVANGRIAVAYVDGEATVKRIHIEDGVVSLEPENPDFDTLVITPQAGREVTIAGPVIGVIRRYT